MKIFCQLLFIVFLSGWSYGQSPLRIDVYSMGELSGALEEFQDQIMITINNTSGADFDFYLNGRLTGLGGSSTGLIAHNDASDQDTRLTIPGHGTLHFTLRELIDVYQGTSIEDYEISPASAFNFIRNYRHLPEGTYEFCLNAFDFLIPGLRLNDFTGSCLNFEIRYFNPPIVQHPGLNQWMAPNALNEIQFRWTNGDRSPYSPDITYHLEVVRIPDWPTAQAYAHDGFPQDQFDLFERVLDVDDLNAWEFNTLDADELVDIHNPDILAVRVTAHSERYFFQNNGRSAIVLFVYGSPNECDHPHVNAYISYPSPGDTLPFANNFFVMHFEPECDNTIQLEATYQPFVEGIGPTGSPQHISDPWPRGPATSLSRYFHDYFAGHEDFLYPPGSDYASYIPMLNDDGGGIGHVFQFQRGQNVRATGNAHFEHREAVTGTINNQDIDLTSLFNHPFTVGMPKPRLQSPANDAVVPPGSVTFDFSTGEAPDNLLPPFKIFHFVSHAYPPVVPGLYTYEKCVLQVARERSFDPGSIVFCALKKIQGNPYDNNDAFDINNPLQESVSSSFDTYPERRFDRDHFVNQVYRDIGVSTDLTSEDTVYWRVVWLRDPDAVTVSDPCSAAITITDAMIYHSSEIRRLIFNEGVAGISSTPEDSSATSTSGCGAPCTFPALASTVSAGGLSGGGTFTAAGFTVEVADATGSSSSSGHGFIRLPFLNNIKLRVNLSGVSVNSSGQMVSGSIHPVVDAPTLLDSIPTAMGMVFGMDRVAADALLAGIQGGGKLLSLLSSGSEVSLPIGVDREIDGNTVVVGITQMVFKKDTAWMDAVVNLELPNLEVLNGFISLGARICITPNGFANHVRLYLPRDQVFPLADSVEFRIKGAAGTSSEHDISSVEWDCSGFQALNLTGAFRFPRSVMVPENEHGDIIAGQVEARLGGRVTHGGHFMLNLSWDRFQIPGAQGWGFNPGTSYVDYSDIENPPNLASSLPPGYVHPAFGSGGHANEWKGFFLQEMTVSTPERLQGPGHNRLTFALRNMFIDNTGISFSARAENILRWDGTGSFNGWAASLDTVFYDIMQNNFRQAGFNGKLGLPIADSTQYMIYQAALQHHADSFNFVLSIRPQASMRIPIAMAEAQILPTTYVEASLGSRNYIEANLCATIGIGNDHLPSGSSMPSTVSIPGISIQNLRINSETGFDTTAFAFSVTGMPGHGGSPAGTTGHGGFEDEYVVDGDNTSTMSGFPLSLERLTFSNEGISIQPRLTLAGDNAGFSVAARISLLIDMDLLSSPQRFDLTGVQLERIEINVTSSDVTLNGFLEFYNQTIDGINREGVRGGITMGLNLGVRVGASINAEFGTQRKEGATNFNTPDWFAYFYVDGTVVFSPGISVFSGVTFYGLGGGFYHHMNQSALPGGEAVAAVDGPHPSGARYIPDFGTDLGLKFMVILGSNDEGKMYNLDVTLEATFSFSSGLTYIGFTGSFRVMTDGISITQIGRGSNNPICGYVEMHMNFPAGGSPSMAGQFFVLVQVPPSTLILRGLGTITNLPPGWTPERARNAAVWADFAANEHEWHFYMGTPENRCGIALSVGGQNLLEVTNYLMIGYGLPVVMPDPDSLFLVIFNRGQDPETAFESDNTHDISEILGGHPVSGRSPGGEGVAMGFTMKMQTGDVQFFPFFFNLNAVMGFDFNVTHADPGALRRCAGTDITPGNDGWYATGQMYAGIEGAFGILVNLFGPELRFNIFQGSAALILDGGLPNPEWISGRGSFYYNVCDGLVEGRCSFALEAGTQCHPVIGDPFADVQLIQDITPANGSTDVSIYTTAAVAFSMEMEKTYVLEEYTSSTTPPAIRSITPYLVGFTLHRTGSAVNLPGAGSWDDTHRIYTFTPDEHLAPDGVSYTIDVEARFREGSRDVMSGGTVFRALGTSTFTTGAEPDHLVDENLYFTYPYIRQDNFLKGETIGNRGYVVCRTPNNSFLMPGDISSVRTTFTARFISEHQDTINVPATVTSDWRSVTFDVSGLNSNTLYCLQIIRKDEPVNMLPEAPHLAGLGESAYTGVIPISQLANAIQMTPLNARIGNSTVTSLQLKTVQLPEGIVGRFERQIYVYYFHTSQYNTMRDKILANRTGWVHDYINLTINEYSKLQRNMSERFEWTDLNDFRVVPVSTARLLAKSVAFRMEPPPTMLDGVVTPGPITSNQYLNNVVRNRMNGQYAQALIYRDQISASIRTFNSGVPVPVPSITPPSGGYGRFNRTVQFDAATRALDPLSDVAIQSAFTTYSGVGTYTSYSSPPPGTTGSIPLPSGLSGTSYSTVIQYYPQPEGRNQYVSLRHNLNSFYGSRVLIGSLMYPTVNFMNTTQRNFFLTHLNRNSPSLQGQYMYLITGNQTFGVQYVFPALSGNSTLGTLTPISFYFSRS